MENKQPIPREAIIGIAVGALMMAVFTVAWASIANAGLDRRDHHIVLLIFSLLSLFFVCYSIYLFRLSKNFPRSTSEADIAERKRVGKWWGILFGLEGITIPIAVNVVIALGHPELVIPVIALVVGLHFFPMAKIFKRTIDYYLASWTTAVALTGIFLLLYKTMDSSSVFAIVGIGLACATSTYGLLMFYKGMKFTK